jgi:hypothetical protein
MLCTMIWSLSVTKGVGPVWESTKRWTCLGPSHHLKLPVLGWCRSVSRRCWMVLSMDRTRRRWNPVQSSRNLREMQSYIVEKRNLILDCPACTMTCEVLTVKKLLSVESIKYAGRLTQECVNAVTSQLFVLCRNFPMVRDTRPHGDSSSSKHESTSPHTFPCRGSEQRSCKIGYSDWWRLNSRSESRCEACGEAGVQQPDKNQPTRTSSAKEH